jgi:hypothetical protein
MVVQILQQVAVFLETRLKPAQVLGAELIDHVDVLAGYPVVLCHNMKYTEMTGRTPRGDGWAASGYPPVTKATTT